MLLPATGWRRAANYLGHRVKRLPDSPHRIALGLACGVFVSFSPFFGLHFFLAALFAYMLRGNVLAGLMGTAVGNPISFPPIAASSIWVGNRLVGYDRHHIDFVRIKHAFYDAFSGLWESFKSIFGLGENELYRMGGFFREVFFPYLLGGVIAGSITSVIVYFVALPLIRRYQTRRRERLIARAYKRLQDRLGEKREQR